MAFPAHRIRRILRPVLAPAHTWVRKTAMRWSHRAIILTYHRVARLPGYPYRIVVDPEHFDQHMKILKKWYRPIGLSELRTCLNEGVIPSRTVVVTFDDGYADILQNAIPIIARYSVPAAVFVVSGAVGNNMEQWWDRLERLVKEVIGSNKTQVLDGGTNMPKWHVGPDTNLNDLLNRMHSSLRILPPEHCHRILDQLHRQRGLKWEARSEHRFLTVSELRHMAGYEDVEIGAHTVNHPLLASLPLELQEQEIRESKKQLEQTLGKSVRLFSYPYGDRGSFLPGTVDAVKKSEFELACTSFHEPVCANTPHFELPRCAVHNWNGPELRRRLDFFFAIRQTQAKTSSRNSEEAG